MNYQDRVAPDPRTYAAAAARTDRHEASADGIAAFVSESTIAGTPFKIERPSHPLWEFPEEAAASADSRGTRWPVRKAHLLAAASAAFVVSSAAGVWWLAIRPTSTTNANPATAQIAAPRPEIKPPAAAPPVAPAQVIPSVEVRPLRVRSIAAVAASIGGREDVERPIAPPKPVALSVASLQQRNATERTTSTPLGTSGRVAEPPRNPESRSSTTPLPPPPIVASNTMARAVIPEPPPAVAASPAAALPAARTAEPVVARPEPEAFAVVPARTEQSAIQQALGQYRSAYQRLDADAARAVWPSVDVRALARAFDSLSSQERAFDSCQFDVAAETATAQCRGSATYTPKIGSRGARLEPRQWVFQLRKAADGWKIQSAQTRR